MWSYTSLAWQALFLGLIWVPFAVIAGLIDTWNTEGGRAFRAQVAHPFVTMRTLNEERRLRHAHAH